MLTWLRFCKRRFYYEFRTTFVRVPVDGGSFVELSSWLKAETFIRVGWLPYFLGDAKTGRLHLWLFPVGKLFRTPVRERRGFLYRGWSAAEDGRKTVSGGGRCLYDACRVSRGGDKVSRAGDGRGEEGSPD